MGFGFPARHSTCPIPVLELLFKTRRLRGRLLRPLPVDGFRTIEVDVDQSRTTTKPVKMAPVAYVSALSRNLFICKAVDQWHKSLVCYKTNAVQGFPGEPPHVFNLCPRKQLFSATGVRRIPGQDGGCGGEGARYNGKHCILIHPSEKKTQKPVEAMRIVTTALWGSCEVRL